MRVFVGIILLALPVTAAVAAPLPIDPLWDSAEFRKAFTASYGIDARIEPKVTSAEKAVLDTVAAKMAAGDRDAAAGLLAGSPLLEESAVMQFSLGNLRFEQQKSEEAIELFQRALALYPNFRDAHRNLAVALVQGSQFERAEPHLRRSLELGAQDGLTLGLLGYCHSGAGRQQAALQSFRMAALTMPEELQWSLGEAAALVELEEYGAAASIFEGALDRAPERSDIWINLADVRLRQGEPLLAIADLEVARRLGGLGTADRVSLGNLYLNESLPARALESYRAALGATPPAPLPKAIEAVESLVRHERWGDARALAAEIEGSPAYQEIIANAAEGDTKRLARARALCELQAGDTAEGAKQVAELVRENPLDGQALLLLANSKLGAGGDTAHGLMLLEQAAAIPSFEARAQRRRGQVLAARGDYAGALPALRKALELEPGDEPLREYLQSVERLARLFERR